MMIKVMIKVMMAFARGHPMGGTRVGKVKRCATLPSAMASAPVSQWQLIRSEPAGSRLQVGMSLVCCSVLQCVAVCCSVLQCVAVCYIVSHSGDQQGAADALR